MSARTHTTDRTDDELPATDASSDPEVAAPAGRISLADVSAAVEIEAKPSAHCCGAMGCHETDALQEVSIDGYGTRVLCLNHAEHLIERETR